MIVKEIIEFNGKKYDYTYSDSGKRIVRDGVTYDTATDPLGSGRPQTTGDPLRPFGKPGPELKKTVKEHFLGNVSSAASNREGPRV